MAKRGNPSYYLLLTEFAKLVSHEYASEEEAIRSVVLKFSLKLVRSVAFKATVLADFIIEETDGRIEAVKEGNAEQLKRHIEIVTATVSILKEETKSVWSFIDDDVCKMIEEEKTKPPIVIMSHSTANKIHSLLYAKPAFKDNVTDAVAIVTIAHMAQEFIIIILKIFHLINGYFFDINCGCETMDTVTLEKVTNNSRVAIRQVRNALIKIARRSGVMKEEPGIHVNLRTVSSAFDFKDEDHQWLCSHCLQWNKLSVTTCINCKETIIISKSEDYKRLCNAMKESCFVEYYVHTAILLQGEAQAGKTSVKSLLLSQPYNTLSTTCIEAPSIGTYSVNRYYGNRGDDKTWTLVKDEEMNEKVMGEMQATAKELSLNVCDNDEKNPKKNSSSKAFPVVIKAQDKREAFIDFKEFIEQCQVANEEKRLGKYHDWLYLIDLDGQMQFQKLLSAFIPCVSVLLVIINLATNLTSTTMQLPQVSEPSMKVEEILRQLVSSISSTAHEYRSAIAQDESLRESIKPPPGEMLNIITIATHRDEYEQLLFSKEAVIESIEVKEGKLRQIYESVANKCTVIHKEDPPYSIIYEVDGRKAKESVFNDPVIERIKEKLKSQAYKIKVPLKYHCFGVVLRKKAKTSCGVLSLSSCLALGESCQLSNSEVICALKFFHTLNMMLYYPNSHTANDIVFVQPDALIEIVKELMLMVCSFRNKVSLAPADIKQLITQGCLSISVLKKSKKFLEIAEKFQNFETKVLGIFEHLFIAAQISDCFLMPALLPMKDVSEINPYPRTTPLLFYFEEGLPMGLFCTVLAHLLSKKLTNPDGIEQEWILISSTDTSSNYITLRRYNNKGSNVFIEGPNYIELHSEYPDYRTTRAIEEAIQITMTDQKLSANEKAVKAFYCPCKEGGFRHAAVVEGSGEHEYVLSCTITGRAEKNDKAGLWLEKRVSTSRPNFSELIKLLMDISDKWREMGVALEVPTHILNSTRNNCTEDSLRLVKVLEYWRDNPKLPYTWESVKKAVSNPIVGMQHMVEAIDKLLLM